MVPFNRPPKLGNEEKYLFEALRQPTLSGNGNFSKKCQHWFEKHTGTFKALLTPSCTAALEMAAILADIKPGDEVIVPSYTFVSTANAFVLRGAKIVFVDIRPDTMNIDETKIEAAVTPRTKAIVPVHYAGVGCEMDTIMQIAEKYDLFVVEDAAQGMMATYKGKALGTIGHLGCYSFHETKNYTSGGEGGVLLINDERFVERAEIIREKGTNRNQFFRGEIDKYTWIDVGSSYLPSELQAAYLYAQLLNADIINRNRLDSWQYYFDAFEALERKNLVQRPFVPSECIHNAHMFYLKVKNPQERDTMIQYLKQHAITAQFHYVPLHDSPAGKRYGYFHGEAHFTINESQRLVRLPMYYNISKEDQKKVIHYVTQFFSNISDKR